MFGRKKKLAASSTDVHAPDGLEIMNTSDLPGDSSGGSAALATLSQLFDVYQPGVVFGEPITNDENTVITAAEVHVAMGLGHGYGSGGEGATSGEGGGVGGGGGSAGRPVAAILISPTGVRVEPIVDVTKLGLAFFTTLGAMFMIWRGMRRAR